MPLGQKIGAKVLGFAKAASEVPESQFHIGTAVGREGQFQPSMDQGLGQSIRDVNGVAKGGEVLICRFAGLPVLDAADLTILV